MTSSPAYANDLLTDSAPADAGAPFGAPDLAMRQRTTYHMQSPVLVCTECGREIAGAGRTCPHCTRSGTAIFQNVQVLVVALVAVAFLTRVFALFLS